MLDVWKKLKKHLIPKWWVFYGDESHGTPPNDATGPTPSIATTWGAAKQSPYKSDMVLDGLTGSWYNTVVLWRSHNVYIYIYTYINTYYHTCTLGCELRQVANRQKGGWRIVYPVWERVGIPAYTLYIFKGPCFHPFCRFHERSAVNNCTSNINQPTKTPVLAICELQPKNHSQHEKKYKVLLLMANLECSISWLVPHHHLSHEKKTRPYFILVA